MTDDRRGLTIPFARYLNIRSCTSPSFSYDDRTVYYLTDVTGTYQVWSAPVDGGCPQQRTFVPDRVQSVHASPTDDRVQAGTDWGGNEHQQFYLLEQDTTDVRPFAIDPEVIHHYGHWSPDGSRMSYAANYRSRAYFDVCMQDIHGARRAVYEDDSNTYPGPWSPDGSCLIFSRNESSAQNSLFVLDVQRGEASELTPHTGDARYEQVQWHPTNGLLYLLSDEGRDFMALCQKPASGGTLEPVVAPDHDVDGLALSPDGAMLAYTVNVDGYSRLVLRRVEGGKEHSPDGLPPCQIVELSWSNDSRMLAFVLSGPQHPAEIYVWNLAEPLPRRLTFSGRGSIREASFIEPEVVHFPTFDGRHIPAYLYRPAPAGQLLPIIVHVHGGPESQARVAFNPIFQFLLHRGFGLLVPNVRGSTGYGKAYGHLDDVHLRMNSVRDLESAVGWLIDQRVADPNRIAVMGGSYGGFMTLAAITSYPDLWAAAVDIVGLANFETFFEQTSVWRRSHRAREYGDPVKDRDLLRSISPIHKIDRVKAPLIVIHGKNDPRVPVGEAEQIVRTVRQQGGTVDYLLFEDEGHGVAKLPNRIRAYEAIAAFLERHLLKERPA